jgi:hypothetical protein
VLLRKFRGTVHCGEHIWIGFFPLCCTFVGYAYFHSRRRFCTARLLRPLLFIDEQICIALEHVKVLWWVIFLHRTAGFPRLVCRATPKSWKTTGMTINIAPVFAPPMFFARQFQSASEAQVKAKLDFARWKYVISNLSGSGSTNHCIGNSVVLHVENVEEFRPEGNEISFTNREILEHREIRVVDGQRAQYVSSKISNRSLPVRRH